jgi:hypothetical protein
MSFKLQIKKLNEDNLVTESTRLMAFKIDQLLLNGLENSVTLIGKNTIYYVKEQKIMELEIVKLLEKQKSLERQAFVADKKAIILI